MPIELVAIDLDGTLLDSNKRLTVRSHGAIERANRLGVKVVIASARPPRTVQPLYDQLGLRTVQINYNGAMVWDPRHSMVLMHRPLTPEAARAVITAARECQPEVLVSIEMLNKWCTDRYDAAQAAAQGWTLKPDCIAPLDEILGQPVTKLMFLAPPEAAIALEERLNARFGQQLAVARVDEAIVQVMHPRAGKSAALSLVADLYDVDRDQVMAIGDALNDLGMIQWAGLGIAVHNAHPRVRQAADYITASNDEDGVAEAIEMFVIGNSPR
ncbi:MAG: 5-amino-6-(5-phospho-D-ribitylamino)uracil phosphatase YitU [Phycisphaerae bacterium]|nr:5-amino-6-(5-phospho-D-ribitylamino)uracil phosphatase YitU [Phycisphaerae bacterium]